MIVLGVNDSLNAVTTTAATVNCTVVGVTTDSSIPPIAQVFDAIFQGQVAAAAAALFTNGATTACLISSIHLYNTSSTVPQVVTLGVNGNAASNSIATVTIPVSGFATYEDGNGWTVYSSTGLIVGTSGSPGGVGTPATAAQSLTASAANLVVGTSVALATNQMFVGMRYRWEFVLTKTAAGVATWTVAVKFGTANTTSDAAIATWTSGTNTALIDKATLAIEMVVASLGAAATANCIAMYTNAWGTNVTGLGDVAIVPSPTATFDSRLTSPFLHVDITPGASAVMTAAASAERLV